MKTRSMLTKVVAMAAMATVALAATPSHATVIFTEDFESPDTAGSLFINPGPTAFENAATVGADTVADSGGSPGSAVRLVEDPFISTNAQSGSQFLVMGHDNAIGSFVTFEVAAANTLVNGSTLGVSLYTASIFNDTTDETFDIILSGGAVGTQSDTADSAPAAWQEHTFNFTVTNAALAINLTVDLTRGSSASEDFALDLITVDGSVVPEPATFALAIFGLLSLGMTRGRRRRR